MNKGMLAMLMVDTLTRGATAGDGRLTLAEPAGPGRKAGPGELVCTCCGENAADCRHTPPSGSLEPTCDLCAAPGAQRHALEIEPGETPEP